MMKKLGKVGVVGIVASGMMLTSGCALLEQFTGTTTSDSNAKMNLGEFKGIKHAVGCKKFENQAGWHGSWELGDNLSIMLESALFDTGRFVLVEREKLNDIIAEQDLGTSGSGGFGRGEAVIHFQTDGS